MAFQTRYIKPTRVTGVATIAQMLDLVRLMRGASKLAPILVTFPDGRMASIDDVLQCAKGAQPIPMTE